MIELMIHSSLLPQDRVHGALENIERKEKGTAHDKRAIKVRCPPSLSLSLHPSFPHSLFNFPLPLGVFSHLIQGGP